MAHSHSQFGAVGAVIYPTPQHAPTEIGDNFVQNPGTSLPQARTVRSGVELMTIEAVKFFMKSNA